MTSRALFAAALVALSWAATTNASADPMESLLVLDKASTTQEKAVAIVNDLWRQAEQNPVICIELASRIQEGPLGLAIMRLFGNDVHHPCRKRMTDLLLLARPDRVWSLVALAKDEELQAGKGAIREVLASDGRMELKSVLVERLSQERWPAYASDILRTVGRGDLDELDEFLPVLGSSSRWGYTCAEALYQYAPKNREEASVWKESPNDFIQAAGRVIRWLRRRERECGQDVCMEADWRAEIERVLDLVQSN